MLMAKMQQKIHSDMIKEHTPSLQGPLAIEGAEKISP